MVPDSPNQTDVFHHLLDTRLELFNVRLPMTSANRAAAPGIHRGFPRSGAPSGNPRRIFRICRTARQSTATFPDPSRRPAIHGDFSRSTAPPGNPRWISRSAAPSGNLRRLLQIRNTVSQSVVAFPGLRRVWQSAAASLDGRCRSAIRGDFSRSAAPSGDLGRLFQIYGDRPGSVAQYQDLWGRRYQAIGIRAQNPETGRRLIAGSCGPEKSDSRTLCYRAT
jgi:uncharacterized protein (DUF3820 family)